VSASVAHELNTPLTVLRGSIEKMLETSEDAAAHDRLHRMLRVTQRLQKISETLVDFSRVRTEHPEPAPVRPLVEEAWNLVAFSEKAANAHFENRASEQHIAFGNPDRLVQVFVNLLRNAAHAIQSSGTIVVESRMEESDNGRRVLISVEDDGPGIPPDVLPDIFEAFVTTRLDARGTGLGLSVAEGIVEQHGGTISASNRAGGGARLEVRLPAAPVNAGEANG
jgi:signal transduction histidine kinase